MIALKDYPRLERVIRDSPDLGSAVDTVFDLYKEKRRISGKLVIQHCLETGEIISRYTSKPVYLVTGIYHDGMEDLGLSFEDVKRMSGKDGVRVAQLVTALSKRADLKDREMRNREYTERQAKAIEKDHWVGIIKLSDRLSNLTDIQALPPEKRKAIAIQTIEFYVPIALRLGIPRLANELRALSLPHVVQDSERIIDQALAMGEFSKALHLARSVDLQVVHVKSRIPALKETTR